MYLPQRAAEIEKGCRRRTIGGKDWVNISGICSARLHVVQHSAFIDVYILGAQAEDGVPSERMPESQFGLCDAKSREQLTILPKDPSYSTQIP